MSELTTVARPYASAAFEFALEQGKLDAWQDMLQFAAAVAQDDSVSALLSGNLAPEKLAELFIQICDKHVDEHGQNLLKVMAENGRLAALPQVAQQYQALRTEHEKVVEAHVTSASELNDKQKAAISKKLDAHFGTKVRLHCSVDESLIGGFIAKAGDEVIDNSVRGQLRRLTDALQS